MGFDALYLRVNQTQLNSDMDELYRGFCDKFFHNFCTVGFDRTQTDTEHIGDCPGGVSFGYKLKYLPFPVGKQFETLFPGRAFMG